MSRHGGDYAPRGPERWDRSRFEAVSRGPPVVERERYEEVDYYSRPRDRSAEPYRPPPTRGPIYKEEERYEMPYRSRPAPARYYEEERDPYEGAMVHRPRERPEFEIDIREREVERRAEPARPRFVRRQSSLDTHDRKPMARYGDRVKEETIMIPSGRRRSPPRYHSPPRREEPRYEERDYEEIRVTEPDLYGDEYYRGYREREISRFRKSKRREEEEEVDERESVQEEEDVEEEKEFPRRGKTRMPMRLVEKKAVIELGYPFEEEEGTLIILKALGKEHIDEVIKLSKEMKNAPPVLEEKRTTYVFERTSPSPGPPAEGKVIERRTEIIREGSPESDIPRSVREWDQMSMSKKSGKAKSRRTSSQSSGSDATHHTEHHSHHSRRRSSHHARARSVSSAAASKHEIILMQDREESATIRGGINALVIPAKDRRSSRNIQKEIKALEAEKRSLQIERETDYYHEGRGGELIITRDRDDVVEVKKDKKATAPDPRIIRAMLATLT